MTYIIANNDIKKRMDSDNAVYKKILSHLEVGVTDLSYCTRYHAPWSSYINDVIQRIENADRIVDIRAQDDPWDRRYSFESNIEINYALLIGKTVECAPFHVEDNE